MGQAQAQENACSAAAVGSIACIADKLCACISSRGSPATGLPDGYRWDCDILRPSCGPPAPATLDPWQRGLPDALAIDRTPPFGPPHPIGKGRLPPW
jgi:hypothetical protein